MSNLIPTIITNKNGVVTTVYRKPSEGLKKQKLAPVAPSTDTGVYALMKSLNARIKQLGPDARDTNWRKRSVKTAAEEENVILLHRMDQYFDVKFDDFNAAVATVEEAGHDISDDELFDKVIKIHGLVDLFASGRFMSPMVPLLETHPVQEVAHCWNVISRKEYRAPTFSEMENLLDQQGERSDQLPAFIAETVTSSTPVDDYRLVCKDVFNQPEVYAYQILEDWDRQAVSYMAEMARSQPLFHELTKRFKELRAHPRKATEYASMVGEISDLFGSRTTGYEPHLRGPNAKHIDEVMRMANQYREQSGHPLIETADDLTFCAAQLRFALTIEHAKSAFMYGNLPMNKAVMKLIREHSSPKEVEIMVNLFNERGIDPALAEERLKNGEQASAIGSGWL